MKLFRSVIGFWKKQRRVVKVLVIILLLAGIYFGYTRVNATQTQAPSYQTQTVEKGTLVVAVSSSGTVSTSRNASVTTQASGVVSHVYVKNGDVVTQGSKIAELTLDMLGQQKSTQAWASYQSASNALASAKANLYTSQVDLLTNWEDHMDLAQSSSYENDDNTPNDSARNQSEFIISQDKWLSAEAKYKIQQQAITQAQSSLTAAWISYQQSSPVIYAPISGTVSGLTLTVGSIIGTDSDNTNQNVAQVTTKAPATVTVNLTEIDVPKVKVGNKVTVTVDAFADKTFTGSVISVDSSGTVSSGVTTYPTTIVLDDEGTDLFPNMSIQANIITQTKDNIILIPSSAIQTQNGESYVRVMTNGNPENVPVTTGVSSDTQTEIISGLTEGQTIVTGTTGGTTTRPQTTGQSPFSPFGNAGTRTGAGAATQVRIVR